jgi:hypothetical protein
MNRDHIFRLKLEYEAVLHKAASQIINQEDAADVCSQLWVDLISDPPAHNVDLNWLVQQAQKKSRSLRGQLIKNSRTIFSYTENPSNVLGEISDVQLEQICSRLEVYPPDHRLMEMRQVFYSLSLEDRNFLISYHNRDIPRSVNARQRAYRLKKKLQTRLSQNTES